MRENENRVVGCTSPHFRGFVSMMRPDAFVSRFNGLDKRQPGCYALMVPGKIPEYILNGNVFFFVLARSKSRSKHHVFKEMLEHA